MSVVAQLPSFPAKRKIRICAVYQKCAQQANSSLSSSSCWWGFRTPMISLSNCPCLLFLFLPYPCPCFASSNCHGGGIATVVCRCRRRSVIPDLQGQRDEGQDAECRPNAPDAHRTQRRQKGGALLQFQQTWTPPCVMSRFRLRSASLFHLPWLKKESI